MFRHVGIVVNDIEKQIAFYKDGFGFEIVSDEIESGDFLDTVLGKKGLEPRIVKLGVDGYIIVELLDFKDNSNSEHHNEIFEKGFTHFALTVDDVDYYSLYLPREFGISIISKPKVNPSKTAKVCFIKDPEDNYIELVEVL